MTVKGPSTDSHQNTPAVAAIAMSPATQTNGRASHQHSLLTNSDPHNTQSTMTAGSDQTNRPTVMATAAHIISGHPTQSSVAAAAAATAAANSADTMRYRTGGDNSSSTNGSAPIAIANVELRHKIVGDVLTGASVALCVAPFLTIVDKAIVEKSAGTKTMVQSGIASIKAMMRQPVAYLRSPTFFYMWLVYTSTYSAANSLKTIGEHDFTKVTRTQTTTTKRLVRRRTYEPTTQFGNALLSIFAGPYSVLLGTALTNTATSITKDRAYAKMFGSASAAKNAIPRTTYALWLVRDFSVIGSAFVLPDLVANAISDPSSNEDVKKMTQVSIPIVTQVLAGPLHFIGLDLYNRNLDHKPFASAMRDRGAALAKNFAPVVSARIARIAPGYSMGGVLNTSLRDTWRNWVSNKTDMAPIKSTSTDGVPTLGVMATTTKNQPQAWNRTSA